MTDTGDLLRHNGTGNRFCLPDVGSCTKLGDAGISLISETVTTSIPVLKDLTVSGAVHQLWVACAALCTRQAGRGISMAPYA